MNRFAATASAKRPARLVRVVLTLVALFAFTLQSVITQVHFHDPSPVAAIGGKTAPDKNPDSQNCPICQGILHAGLFTQPAASALPLPAFTTIALTFIAQFTSAKQLPSHSWQSRGPPAR